MIFFACKTFCLLLKQCMFSVVCVNWGKGNDTLVHRLSFYELKIIAHITNQSEEN